MTTETETIEKKVPQHSIILKSLKEFGGAISSQDLADLTDIKKTCVHACVSRLIKSGQPIVKEGDRRNVLYHYSKDASTIIIKNEHGGVQGGTVIKKTVPKSKAKSQPDDGLDEYVERCFHLIHARDCTSTQTISEFFNITLEEANVVMNRLIRKYPKKIGIESRCYLRK